MKAIVGSTYTPQYVLSIANEIVQRNSQELTDWQIQELIQRQAMEDQREREIQTGRKWRDYQKRQGTKEFMYRATRKTIRPMLAWRLLQPIGDGKYHATKDLVDLGESRLKSYSDAVKLLYGITLRSDRTASLSPTEDLIPIRDSSASSKAVVPGVEMDMKSVLLMEKSILKNTIGRSVFDSDILLSWGQFFGLLNAFDPSTLGLEGAKQMFPSFFVATIAELQKSTGNPNDRHDIVYLRNALKSHSSSDLGKALTSMTPEGWWVVSEDERSRGQVMEIMDLDPAKVTVLAPRKPQPKDFDRAMKESYCWLLKSAATPYVWITSLRNLVCRLLLISGQTFDDSLRSMYDDNPDSLDFSTTAGSLTRRLRRFEKAFSLYGQKYRMIRLT